MATKTKKAAKLPTQAHVSYTAKHVHSAFACLEAVEATSSKLAKEKLLYAEADNMYLRSLLRRALDRSRFGLAPATFSTYTNGKSLQRLTGNIGADPVGIATAFETLADSLVGRKVTGNAAKQALSDFLVPVAKTYPVAAKWYHRVLAKKLQANIDRTVDKVWPNLMIRWGVPKGVSLVDQKSNAMIRKFEDVITDALDDGVDSQPKCDGVHGVAACDSGGMHSSSGDAYPAVDKYAAAIAEAVKTLSLPDVFDGYVPLVSGECEAVFDPKKDKAWKSPWGKGGAIAKYGRTPTGFKPERIDAAKQKHIDDDFKFVIYDIYPDIAQRESVKIKRDVKRRLLKEIVAFCDANAKRLGIRKGAITLIQQKRCYSWDELRAAHEHWIACGYEGSILRFRHSLTLADSKTRAASVNFMKWKEYDYFDGIILGVAEGKKNTKNEGKGGAFIVWVPGKNETVHVTVPTLAARELALKHANAVIGYHIEAVQQVDPGGSVAKARFPVMKRFRDDMAPLSVEHVARIAAKAKLEVTPKRNTAAQTAVAAIADACNAFAPGVVISVSDTVTVSVKKSSKPKPKPTRR